MPRFVGAAPALVEGSLEQDWGLLERDSDTLLHSLHPYRTRFSPSFARRALERYSKRGDLVLDPFCGSGTTLLECALAGRNSVGVDCNAVAVLISRAKIHSYVPDDLQVLREVTRTIGGAGTDARLRRDREALREAAPRYRTRDLWFDDPAVLELSLIRETLRPLPEGARLLGTAVLSAIIVQVSRQAGELDCHRVNRPCVPGMTLRLWVLRVLEALVRAEQTQRQRKSSRHRVIEGDARTLQDLRDASVDLILTGQHYLNSLDYHRIHRHRLHWIGADARRTRERELGRREVYGTGPQRESAFHRDLGRCMSEWMRVLRPGSRAVVMTGDTFVGNRTVATVEPFLETAMDAGFDLEARWSRIVPPPAGVRHRRTGKEEVLLLRKGENE